MKPCAATFSILTAGPPISSLILVLFLVALGSASAQTARQESSPIAQEKLANLEQLNVIDLLGELHHVQGIEVEAGRVWVTSVDRATRSGYLHRFALPSGELEAQTTVHVGDKYHPGGIAAGPKGIWIPVAPYSRAGVTNIECRDRETLELIERFTIDDHIGCLAVEGDLMIGGNWDARKFYVWKRDPDDRSWALTATIDNPTPNHYQDMKLAGGRLVASGKIPGLGGAIDWLDPETLHLERRIRGGATDRGTSFMNEGMALGPGRLYLLPEDGPSRLFVFKLD